MPLTNEQMKSIFRDSDPDIETEHRKYSEFYAWGSLVIDEELVQDIKEEYPDIAEYLGKRFSVSGLWSDSYGLDISDIWVEESYTEIIPEQIIPAHEVTKWKKIGG